MRACSAVKQILCYLFVLSYFGCSCQIKGHLRIRDVMTENPSTVLCCHSLRKQQQHSLQLWHSEDSLCLRKCLNCSILTFILHIRVRCVNRGLFFHFLNCFSCDFKAHFMRNIFSWKKAWLKIQRKCLGLQLTCIKSLELFVSLFRS